MLSLHFLELYLVNAFIFGLIRRFKYYSNTQDYGTKFDDLRLLLPLSAIFFAPICIGGHGPAAFGFALATAFLVALWVDAILFRLFSVEIDFHGLRTILPHLPTGFSSEMLGMVLPFLRRKRHFSLLPLVALPALAGPLLFRDHGAEPLLLVPLLAASAFELIREVRDDDEGQGAGGRLLYLLRHHFWLECGIWLILGLSVLSRVAGVGYGRLGASNPVVLVVFAGAMATLELATRFPGSSSEFLTGRSFLRSYIEPRPLRDQPGFEPRPQHAGLLSMAPAKQLESERFGFLRGANVVLVMLESVARDYLSIHRPGQARTPFLADLSRRALRSRNHFCVVPASTAAHRCLYGGGYGEPGDSSPMRALVDAGYQTLFLSPTDTSRFGFSKVLERACFAHTIDATAFTPGPRDGGLLSDLVLLDQGIAHLENLLDPRRFFLQVQMVNTHASYRVIDQQRFCRFDNDDERGRLLNGIEETDWILAQFFRGLRQRGFLDDTIVIVSSDHGEAFGEFGYRSHANAVIKEEINVPLLFHHPRIEPRDVEFSSHFDILPTVLDALGIRYSGRRFGRSLFAAAAEPRLLLCSETRRRGQPSNVGLICGDSKVMFDVFYDRYCEMGWDDVVRRDLVAEEKAYYATLFYRALAAAGWA